MDQFVETLKARGFEGEADISDETLQTYSHDASLFEVVPKMVVYPKNSEDLKRLVVSAYFCREKIPDISLTARSAGTDMGGGAINDSIIIDFTHHLNKIEKVSS